MRIILSLILCLATIWPAFAAPLRFPEGAGFEVGYSATAEAQALALVLKGIDQAQKSILVAAYSFTSRPIATALLAAHKRGVHVAIIADRKSNGAGARYSAANFLANQGVPVVLNGKYQIFHHKFMVIDGAHVETGSFNYSASAASRNAENVLLIWNAPELAGQYTREWQRLWGESEKVGVRYAE